MVSAKRFIHLNCQFDQYFHIYNARLSSARESLIKNSKYRWGDAIENVPLEQLNTCTDEVFVIGTLFKLMPKQPKSNEDNDICSLEANSNFTSEEDSLVLHETDENVPVVGEIDVHMHVTGIPISLKGRQLNGGAKFQVNDICYAGPNLDVYKMPQANGYNESKAKYKDQRLLIVSGLEFGFDTNSATSKFKNEDILKALKKLVDFVMGDNVHDHDNGEFVDYNIVKIIVAGNSIAPGYTKAQIEMLSTSESKDNRTLKEVFQMFDKYLFTLAQSGAEIDVMPGKNDPTSFLLPQQPFHPKILPQSGSLENVTPITNPCLIDYKDYLILGTSGENVEAIRQYSRIEYSTTALKNTLEWGHIAPSAPDNLSCVPFKEKDPFIIDFVPDIYFAGNQPEYAVTTYSTETKSKIQLISVPSFVRTLSCVLINLSNLEAELVTLK